MPLAQPIEFRPRPGLRRMIRQGRTIRPPSGSNFVAAAFGCRATLRLTRWEPQVVQAAALSALHVRRPMDRVSAAWDALLPPAGSPDRFHG